VVTNNAPTTFPLGVTVVTWTATDAAGNKNTATQTVTVVPLANCSSSITAIPENNTYTGGIPTNIYLGYGPQRVTLRANASGGVSYTYNWTVVSGNATLSSTTSSQPVFAPTQAGTYTFEVSVRTQAGCVSKSRITICVRDIRVYDSKGRDTKKVYVCHRPPGNPSNVQILHVSINAVPAHIGNHEGDQLGSCADFGCAETAPASTIVSNTTATAVATESVPTTKKVAVSTESDLEIKVMGNPSRSFFTIQMESKHDLPIQVRVFDINGRPLESKANQLPNSTIQIGHNLGSGTYYAEFLQGTRRKIIQLIKVR